MNNTSIQPVKKWQHDWRSGFISSALVSVLLCASLPVNAEPKNADEILPGIDTPQRRLEQLQAKVAAEAVPAAKAETEPDSHQFKIAGVQEGQAGRCDAYDFGDF